MMKTFELLGIARELQGISQIETAKKAGITQSAISKFEAGLSTLSEETLLRIAPLLNINSKYITGDSQNPFSSSSLIKMYFQEKIGFIDFQPLSLLVESNKILEFVFFIPHFRLISPLLSKTVLEIPCCAIAVRDGDGNYFIFRRKSKSAFIVGERELESNLSELSKKNQKDVYFRKDKIDKVLYQKIKNWTVSKEDIKGFFRKELPLLSEEEKKIVIKHSDDPEFHNALLAFLKSYDKGKNFEL